MTKNIALHARAACSPRAGQCRRLDPHYPPRPEGCDVKVFHGKVAGIVYDDIGRVDSICGNDMTRDQCIAEELKNQTCKLGGDLVYDVPEEPPTPSPDKIRFAGRVAHTRAP